MQLTAECVLVHDVDGWTAEFPAFGAATSGRTRDEALKRAREILEIEAYDLMEAGSKAPKLRHLAEVAVLTVDVTEEDAERSRYVSKAQAAERLDISRPRVTALAASGRLAVKKFDGQEFVSIESISEYVASPRVPGRPVGVKAAR